jgi:hypothetical protein
MASPRFSRRTLLGGSLALAAGGGVIGCSTATSPAPGENAGAAAVTYQLSWTHSVQFGGTYLAVDRGLFRDLGLDVRLAPGGPNVAGDANTVSGAALVNIAAADGVARSNAEGADLMIIGAQYQKSAGLDLEAQRKQADVQLDVMFSPATDANGFASFTDEQVQENLELFGLLGIEGATEELWDRSILDEVYQSGPTV